MKKILVISNTTFSIEKFRFHYLSKIKKYYFKIYTPEDKRNLKLKNKNLEHLTFKNENFFSGFYNIKNIVKKENPHSVIAYSTYCIFILNILKFFFNYNLISVVAGRGSPFYGASRIKLYFIKKIFCLILNFSEKLIFINPADMKYFSSDNNLKEKSYLLPTEGIEKIKYVKRKNNKKNFIFFARLIVEKGIYDYIKLSKEILKMYPNCNFYIAGPISKSMVGQSGTSNIRSIIKKNKKYVKYLGYIKNYKKIYPKMDCLVAPSKLEGAGTAVMEAMQSGLFIIAYKNSGHNFVLKNTNNIICKKNNHVNLIKAVEKYLYYDEKKLNLIKKNSYNKVVKNFESKIISKKFKSILDKPNYKKKKLSLKKLIINFFIKPRELNVSKKKVIHITRYFDINKRFGGIEEVIKQIAFHSKFNHNVLAIGDRTSKLKLDKNLTSLRFKKNISMFNDLFSIQLFKYLLKNKEKYNVIHLHYPSVFGFLYIFLLPFKKNLIVTHHSDIERLKVIRMIIHPFFKFMHRYVNYFHISSKTYFLNSEIRKYHFKTVFEYFSIIKPAIIKLKINFKFKKYVLFISRKSYYKGLNKLEELININPNINFICVTNYEFSKKYKNLVQLNNINENLKYNLIKNSRLIISLSTSRAESFGMTLIEGLFFSKPLISFDINTGVNEIISNNRNGFLIKKFNLKEYSRKLRKIYYSDGIYKKFSTNSKKFVKNFDLKYEKINEIYHQLD